MTDNNNQNERLAEARHPANERTKLLRFLEDAQKRLVNTNSRNRLVHINRAAKRSNSLAIINERTEYVFKLLRVDGKSMRFKATGQDSPVEGDYNELALAIYNEGALGSDARYRDNFLETRLGPETLERRLLRLFTDARTAEEEQGINILYLAMGFLTWFENQSSSLARESPLVLLPVRLNRNQRPASFSLKAGEDDVVTNLPLQERLKEEFGLSLPEIDDSEDWQPVDYLKKVEDLVAERKRWKVDVDGMHLGFFSFAKLLMLHDLEPENWPQNARLEDNELVRGLLLDDGFKREPPLFRPKEQLDGRLEPAGIVQVVDADASQTKVTEEVHAGRNLVVQGPPGTGKSQTIANIIAGAVHDGKSVLFMAEKMAALNVVHDRLKKIDLDCLCIELHSRRANKKAFIEELKRTLHADQCHPKNTACSQQLLETRGKLNNVSELLHTTVPGLGFTPYSVISELIDFIGREIRAPQLSIQEPEKIDDEKRQKIRDLVDRYASRLKEAGPRQKHPFFGVGNVDLQPPDLQRLTEKILDARTALENLRDQAVRICDRMEFERPDDFASVESILKLLEVLSTRPPVAETAAETLVGETDTKRLAEALEAGESWHKSRDEAANRFTDAAWVTPGSDLRGRLVPGVSSFWQRWFGPYRRASAELESLMKVPLPATANQRLELVDELISVQTRRRVLSDDEAWLKKVLGAEWRGERTNFAGLTATANWLASLSSVGWKADADLVHKTKPVVLESGDLAAELKERLETVKNKLRDLVETLSWSRSEGVSIDVKPFSHIHNWLSEMEDNISRYEEWVRLADIARQLEDYGLNPLVEAIDNGELTLDGAVDEFLYTTADARWKAALANKPALKELHHINRHEIAEKFCKLDKNQFQDTQQLLKAKHGEGLPRGHSGQMNFLRGEMAKKTRHRSIRRIIRATNDVIQRIKPVFMMSPISIAQFIPRGEMKFDLLVIDEASQVRPEEALGAIARCSQIVVVGDEKQLPPTTFFERSLADEPEEEEADDDVSSPASAIEFESILTLCVKQGLNSSMLEWHYRSRDPSLMTVNNAEFYDNRLILPPTPIQGDEDYGLVFKSVPGEYSSRKKGKGRPGTNRIEAEAIAARLTELAKSNSKLSIGIVAFSKAQSDMITEVLEYDRRKDSKLEALLREDKYENVFVKNIENVQGDERDVILISVGYGPDKSNGRLTRMLFGPVNSDGGERRLNVLFSRARVRCEVICSFDPGDIDLSRVKSKGSRVLKKFLQYAKTGEMANPLPTRDGFDSPFEEDVARVINGLGYPCDSQVGREGFYIDLGVRHPEKRDEYILAVECDGARYHGALWARERDRLRQDTLENTGWRFHRIWSTDWFYRRDGEIKRLEKALEAAREEDRHSYAGANFQTTQPVSKPASETARDLKATNEPNPKPFGVPHYVQAEVRSRGQAKSPYDAPQAEFVELVEEVVKKEGPIHLDELARRVTEAFGLKRSGSRIKKAVDIVAKFSRLRSNVLVDGKFYMTKPQQDKPPVRDRSELPNTARKPAYVWPGEIRAAASLIEQQSGRVENDELVSATARLLGFRRTGADVREVIRKALDRA